MRRTETGAHEAVHGRRCGGRTALGVALAWGLACGGSGSDAGARDGATSDPGPERTTEGVGLSADASDEPHNPAGEPRAEGNATIVVALPQLPDGLDPLGDLDPWGRRVADDLVFEGLVSRQPDGAPWVEMALADHCSVTRDQIVDCHLRRDVKFHDGSPVTMPDVIYSLSYWLDPRRSWVRQRHGLTTMKSVEVVDAPRGAGERDPGRWISITFAQPEPLALEHLAAIKIVPEKRHRSRASPFASEPVGTGPMRVVSLDQDRVVLERVGPEAWGRTDRELPPTHRIILRAVNDGAQALTLLRRGQVHIVPEVAPSHVPVELGKPGMAARFRAWVRSPARYDVLLWNVGEGLMKNGGLRNALHLAVPRAKIVAEAYGAPDMRIEAPVDLHSPAPVDLEAVVDATASDEGIAGLPGMRDPLADVQGAVAARALLDGLGWKLDRGARRKAAGNLRVTITWEGGAGPGSTTANAVREAWRSNGIQTPYATAPWGYVLNLIKSGSFQVALIQLAEHDDADLYHHYHSRGELNVSGVADAELDRALEDFRAAPDLAGRHEAEQRVADRLTKLRCVTMLFAPAPVMLASRRVRGIVWIDDLPRLDRMWLAAPAEGGAWGAQ